VRAAAHAELQSQKDVEEARRQHAEEQKKREDAEKGRADLKRKLEEMDKQMENLKKLEQKYKEDSEVLQSLTAGAQKLAKTPAPEAEKKMDEETTKQQAVAAAAEEKRRFGTFGTTAFVQKFLKDTFDQRGSEKYPTDVMRPGSELLVRATSYPGDPAGMPRLEFGTEWSQSQADM
jgi:TolA-binding protein